tara:strand:+ start:136 stop:525 length:390 start_codon:yes stop_codon:yes gene_type:complete
MISLRDLNGLRSAPVLAPEQSKVLLDELLLNMDTADWFTIGVMAPSQSSAISAIKEIEKFFSWRAMNIRTRVESQGPVFLKANQKTGDIHIRIEYGLGEGFLLTCQNEDINKISNTFGPFPLDFLREKL